MTSIFNSTKTDRISLSTPNINLSLVKDQGNINEYSKYLDLIEEEIFETQVEVLNIYQKDDFDILKLKY